MVLLRLTILVLLGDCAGYISNAIEQNRSNVYSLIACILELILIRRPLGTLAGVPLLAELQLTGSPRRRGVGVVEAAAERVVIRFVEGGATWTEAFRFAGMIEFSERETM